ncbi:GNAT family N-acetyltransferase [Virgibacillus litoralis]|uniref:Ribosomal protein S18 acetylase RimI-like enzyme n=1 Tax=Virgibacillus litoralis TaxID=578221 RepID=A0ABS4HFK2_9BACI|nr:GNAT family N-acetyltransferase [Virgibacillus litoralis]MBP1949710.1 ribosomal protein S18 acetylase RimI-like enzyme [Virgibacillus litoralis]
MEIQKLKSSETAPMNLLLLADPSEDLIQVYLDQGQCYVAKIDNRLIGVYILLPINSNRVEIKNIAVEESEQGKGVGKQLVTHAIENARFQGFTHIEVGTGNSSINQLALYQKCGFRITGIEKDFFTKNYDEEIIENGIRCTDMIRLEISLKK